ncbi:MAG: twin-arginine translocase TatA/TatE family subunit [Bacteroidales bacterium]|nr:twin-arginine translocase TatA/TatE family subunit [Bacteroidales bacterium]
MNLWIILGILSGWEIVIIVAVVLLLFGGKKIPELMKGLGRGVKEFKDGINNIEEDKKDKDNSSNKK